MQQPKLTNIHLFIIVVAQFAGTSLWFAGNAILRDLQVILGGSSMSGWVTSAVQLGFIAGTLLYTLLAIPDRFPTTTVFLVSVILAAFMNVLPVLLPLRIEIITLSRIGTGFFLAGVYPVGMKIAADWFRPVLGKALGFLVGALVLGTAFPHLIRGIGQSLSFTTVLLTVSGMAVAGGLLLFATIPSMPVSTVKGKFNTEAFSLLFRSSPLRAAAFGYFGHMWELYALWAFMPTLLTSYAGQFPLPFFNQSVWTFLGIAAGFVGCTVGGFLALWIGSQRVAAGQLLISGLSLAAIPVMIQAPPVLFMPYLLLWGATIAGDSPQFSTLVSFYAPADLRGSILTLVTCIGFSITIVSIQGLAWIIGQSSQITTTFWFLLPGPILGLWGMRKLLFPSASQSMK